MRMGWHRQATALSSMIIFVFLVINQGGGRFFSGSRVLNYYEIPRSSSLQVGRAEVDVSRSGNVLLHDGSDERPGRHLLEDGLEDELTLVEKDVRLSKEAHLGAAGEGELSREGEDSRVRNAQELNGRGEWQGLGLAPKTDGSYCTNARKHPGYSNSCSYVRHTAECSSGTLIEYTRIFYCFFSGTPILAYIALAVWLFSLFYTLGNTAADFFCASIKILTELLHLPPTLAGVTLLPFGNGAPDVFASIAAFVGTSGQVQVGLNSVLGGAMFVSSVVAGSVALVMMRPIAVDRQCFVRDIGFFLLTLFVLTAIIFDGKIHFWVAVGYTSIYVLYGVTVAFVEYIRSTRVLLGQTLIQPLLEGEILEHIDIPVVIASGDETSLRQWMWAPHVDIYRQESVAGRQLWGDDLQADEAVKWYTPRGIFSYFIHWPLTIPRRLTIPVVEREVWSKFYAVCSATLAPSLLALVWDGKDNGPFGSAWVEYLVAGGVGIVLGSLSLVFLREDRPPRRYLIFWAAGGFIMSMVWFYVIAIELVAALVALGAVLEIDPAILGLTVLAWGNSIGDLMSNLALAAHNNDGVQIAFSGCYAGPMFNSLIGIGMSFVLSSWKTYPAAFIIPEDTSLFITLAFLVMGLLWALVMLLSQGMRPTKAFGIGLLVLYAAFLTARLAYALDVESILFAAGRR